MNMSARTPQPPQSGRYTSRSTARDKKERLKGFLIAKLRERNGIIAEDRNTQSVLDSEADRLLGKPASEYELRKAEKRILRRLDGAGAPPGGRESARSGRDSVRSSVLLSGRSAISKASTVLEEMATARSLATPGATPKSEGNVKEQGGYDYWLRFMEMDVRNFQREEKVRKAATKKRMDEQKRYLDEQVAIKAKAKKAARQADLSWGVEIKKDYDKWQEENLIAEAKVVEKRKQFVRVTDEQIAEVEARRKVEIAADMEFDKKMLARVRQEMEREKEKAQLKKAEEQKMLELVKVQNAKLQKQKEEVKLAQEREEIKLQKQYAEILMKQERAHKAKQKAFMDEITRKASRFDEAAKEARAKAGIAEALSAEKEKAQIEADKEKYRKDMLEAAEKEKVKAEKVKKDFKEALQLQLAQKAEQERLEKEEVKQQMKALKKELALASKKEEEKARRVQEANYANKLAIDAQIREKQRQKEVGRFMTQQEREMNLGLIRKVESNF